MLLIILKLKIIKILRKLFTKIKLCDILKDHVKLGGGGLNGFLCENGLIRARVLFFHLKISLLKIFSTKKNTIRTQ